MKTVVGLFDSYDDAMTVVETLHQSGFDRNSIRLMNESKGEFGFAEDLGDSHGGNLDYTRLIGSLTGLGVSRSDSIHYIEGVKRGGTLILLTASDDKAQKAYEIIQNHGAVDLDLRVGEWQKTGWTGMEGITTEKRELDKGKVVLPVVEEELTVGKREVERGGVRVYSHVTETPVQEKVNLREEHVHVERRPVDRAVSASDMASLKDKTIELHEKSEEAVISKQARVVEEVVVGKDVTNRTETVRDTVKHTDVRVEQIKGEWQPTGKIQFAEFDQDFRGHFQTTYGKGASFDTYLPAYSYGYNLGLDKRYTTGDWKTHESTFRSRWEETNPGTWEKFKDTIRYSWDKVRGRR